MRSFHISIFIWLFFFLATGSLARSAKAKTHPNDPDYSAALAAANRFLHAWQTEDHETGIVMLSDAARQHASPEFLQNFFSPGPQAAFEIGHGHRRSRGEYEFPIVLFRSSANSSHPQECRIVLVRAKRDDWEVEKLPGSL